MKNDKHSQTFFVVDLTFLYLSFWGTYIGLQGKAPLSSLAIPMMAYIAILWFFISTNAKLTSINIRAKLFDILKNLLVGYSVLSVGIIAAVGIFGDFRHNDKLVLFPLVLAFIGALLFRLCYLITIKHFVRSGYQQKSVLLIGGDRVAERVMKKILRRPDLGYRLHGILADDYYPMLPRGFYLGKLDRFSEIARSGQIDEVIIALPLRREQLIIEMVDRCESEGLRVQIVPDFYRVIRSNQVVLDRLDDIPLIAIRTEPLSLLSNRIVKRIFDIVFSLGVLVLLAPFFLVLAIIIKLSSPGPVFFKQKRIGSNNVGFTMYKFRTMKFQDEKDSDTIWTTANDGRVTGIGRFMRRHNLDELPQFHNVLIGDMSVVGPRPERSHFVEQFRKVIPHYKVRHQVKSGITGWAQVNGFRGDTSIVKRVDCDIHYLENWSFFLDLKIIWLTLLGRKTNLNAY